ncbi:MAG: PIN domain-containing protein [Verrucomicrobiales bacterium]|nr:PIN domain-containing protein [Verrucomicrobiales bacterium]
MTGVDTNLLFAWLNRDHAWHRAAADWMTRQSAHPDLVICELCLVELYGLLRNPAVVRRPLDGPAAVEVIQRLRTHPQWELVDYPGGLMEAVWQGAAAPAFARRRIYDARLAHTLRHHGVTQLATANVKDFEGFGFQRVWNPLEAP